MSFPGLKEPPKPEQIVEQFENHGMRMAPERINKWLALNPDYMLTQVFPTRATFEGNVHGYGLLVIFELKVRVARS